MDIEKTHAVGRCQAVVEGATVGSCGAAKGSDELTEVVWERVSPSRLPQPSLFVAVHCLHVPLGYGAAIIKGTEVQNWAVHW
ncbi:hypothetical protein F5887DRAFT_1163747 [Amanita rubescens]|nr:hypothetical protein F5887DRAFT_1163747 [Amanita rubescens]